MPDTTPEKYTPGEIFLLDEAQWLTNPVQMVEMEADSYLTVRAVETVASGFKWNSPSVDTFACVEVISTNYGDFETGFTQWVVKAKNTDAWCTDTVQLQRKDGSGIDTIMLNVNRGYCPDVQCADLTIQNLDVKSLTACECEPLKAPEGDLYDSVANPQFAFHFVKG
jgi:hypothetical protein